MRRTWSARGEGFEEKRRVRVHREVRRCKGIEAGRGRGSEIDRRAGRGILRGGFEV